jgi:hypothetical protein
MEMLRQQLKVGLPTDALVLLEVQNCLSQTWEQLDFVELAELRKQVLRCEIRPDICWPVLVQSDEPLSETTLDIQWQRFIEQREQDEIMCAWYRDQGIKRIENARAAILAEQAQAGE